MVNAATPVKVQPETLNANRRKKRICLMAIGIFAIIAAVALGVGIAVSNKEEPAANKNEPAPLTPRAKAFQVILEHVSGDSLKNEASAQYQAMNWLANTDEATLTIGVDSEDTIKNRYVVAVL